MLNAAGEALLRSVEPALAQLDDGVQAAAAAAGGAAQRLRVTVLPSFAQRWLLPRMGRWRERHPDLALEIDASQQRRRPAARGLPRRAAPGQRRAGRAWCRERLFDAPLIVVGSPDAARRLLGARPAGARATSRCSATASWERWFPRAGMRVRVNPVAAFNDAGLMLQAAEQNLGIALARELLAADALTPELTAIPLVATEVGRRTLVVGYCRLPLFAPGGSPAHLVLSIRR